MQKSRFRTSVENILLENILKTAIKEDAAKDYYTIQRIDKLFNEYINKLTSLVNPDKFYSDRDLIEELHVTLHDNFGPTTVIIRAKEGNRHNFNGLDSGYYIPDKNILVIVLDALIYNHSRDTDWPVYGTRTGISGEEGFIGKHVLEIVNNEYFRIVFFHEYQHVIDTKERNFTLKSMSKLNKKLQQLDKRTDLDDYDLRQKVYDTYFNSEHETNARYTALVDYTLNKISKYLNRREDEYGTNNFADLSKEDKIEFFLNNIRFDKKWQQEWRLLTPEYRRKFINRLYRLFSDESIWKESK